MASIAIPSYKRSDILPKKTLAFLNRNNIDKERIHIFVVPEEEELYKQTCSGYKIVVGVPTLMAQRAFISSYFPDGEWLVQMDDDVSKVTCKEPFADYISNAIKHLEEEKAGLWGCLPKDDARCYKDGYTTHLTHILGSFFICKNNRRLVTTTSEKEDYERSILYFLEYSKVLRDRSCGVKTTYAAGTGGLQQEGRILRMSNESKLLARLYPHYCSAITKNDKPDIRLNWRAKTLNSELSEILEYLKSHRVEVTKYRPTVAAEARSQTYGIVSRRSLAPDLSRSSWKNPKLFKLLLEYAAKHVAVPFTSIQVNDTLKCAKHFDRGNIGLSYIIAFGDYTGGELDIEGTLHDIKGKPLLFNGAEKLHGTEPFEGQRYSLVFHTINPKPSFRDFPQLSVYEVIADSETLKVRDKRNGALYWGSNGLAHPLKGRVKSQV